MSHRSSKFLDYASLSLQFLSVAENCCAELVARDNAMTVVSDGSSPFDIRAFEDITGWSDHKIAIPILFNFFHGIELTLKAFLAHREVSAPGHKLTSLLAKFRCQYGDSDLAELIGKSILGIDSTSPLANFLAHNNVTIDSWYQTLKYPETTKGASVTHTTLKYKGADGAAFWQGIGHAARDIRQACLALAREHGIAR